MANGATEWGGANTWSAARLEWSSSSNGSSANSSNVTVRLYARRVDGGNSYNYSTANNFWVQCNGATVYGTCQSVSGSNWTLVCSHTFTVGHNNDGSKSTTVAGGGSITGTTFNINSGSLTAVLDKIARYAAITSWTCSSVTQTSASFKWAADSTIDYARVYLNDSSQCTNMPGSVNSTSGTIEYIGMAQGSASIPSVSTLNPSTKYNLKIQVRRKDSQLWTMGSNVSFTTLPIASISSFANNKFSFNIGEDITFTIKNASNNSSSSFAKFYVKSGSSWILLLNSTISKNNTSGTLNTSTIAADIYAKCPSSNSLECKIEFGTTINGKQFYNTYNGTAKVVNSNPIFSDYIISNIDDSINSLLENNLYIIEKHGNMRIKIPSINMAIAQNSANINSYSIIITNSSASAKNTLSHAYSTSDISIDLGNSFGAGTYKVSIMAVDSRNNKSEPVEKTFYVLPYSPPTTSGIVLERVNGYEKEIIANITSFYSKLSVDSSIKNSITSIRYRYAKKDDPFSSWIPLTEFTISPNTTNENLMTLTLTRDYSHGGYLFTNFIPEYAYIVQFEITDKILTSTVEIIVSAGIPIMFRGDNGQVSIGRIPDFSDNSKLQVASDILVTDMFGKDRKVLETINNFIMCYSSEPTDQIVGGIWFKEE